LTVPTATDADVRALVPTTAAGLLARVGPFGPTVEGGALVFDLDPPDELLPLLAVLHTGIRAVLTGRTWYGSTVADGGRVWMGELDPSAPIPPRVGLLTVEGDRCWDRIHPAARIDLPELFAALA
jgi:hypothetical protein